MVAYGGHSFSGNWWVISPPFLPGFTRPDTCHLIARLKDKARTWNLPPFLHGYGWRNINTPTYSIGNRMECTMRTSYSSRVQTNKKSNTGLCLDVVQHSGHHTSCTKILAAVLRPQFNVTNVPYSLNWIKLGNKAQKACNRLSIRSM